MSDDELDEYLDELADEILDPQQKHQKKNQQPEADLEKEMKAIFGDSYSENPNLKQELDDLMKQFGKEKDKEPEFKNVINSAMDRLKDQDSKVDAEMEKDQLNQEELLANLMKGLDMGQLEDLDDDAFKDMDIGKALGEMVSQITSKEMLYEPMKELSEKLPKYIAEHPEHTELGRFKGQLEHVNAIVAVFDMQDYKDDNEEYRKKVNDNLEKLNDLGMPPSDMALDHQNPGMDFNSEDACAQQ